MVQSQVYKDSIMLSLRVFIPFYLYKFPTTTLSVIKIYCFVIPVYCYNFQLDFLNFIIIIYFCNQDTTEIINRTSTPSDKIAQVK